MKHLNLRVFKRSIDSYLENELQLTLPLQHIDFVAIARKNNKHELLKLVQLVLFALVSCPQKELYIHKMMQLGQETQQDLMVLIKKVLGEELANEPNSSQRIQELTTVISELQNHLELLTAENSQLTVERDQLTSKLKDLQLESVKGPTEDRESGVIHRIEERLRVREVKIFELERELQKSMKQHDTQLTTMTDELDLANAQIMKLIQNEKTV